MRTFDVNNAVKCVSYFSNKWKELKPILLGFCYGAKIVENEILEGRFNYYFLQKYDRFHPLFIF